MSGLPSRGDVKPTHFPRLLPFISLIEIENRPRRFRVRLAGTRLRDIYDRETTGLYLDEIDWGDKHDYWMAAYERIADGAKPAQGIVRGPRTQKEHLIQHWLRLPIACGGAEASMILCHDAFLPAAEDGPYQAAANG